MSFLIHHLQAMFDIPTETLALMAGMCSAAMYFVRPHLVVPAMVFILGPISFFLSAVANYALTWLEYFTMSKTDQWLISTIASATFGLIVSLVCAAAIAHAMDKSQARSSRFHRA